MAKRKRPEKTGEQPKKKTARGGARGRRDAATRRFCYLDNRQQTFERKLTRASAKGRVYWPLDDALAEKVAAAGFFYASNAEAPDSVTCFLCGVAVADWSATDDAVQRHYLANPECPLALQHAIAECRYGSDAPWAAADESLQKKLAQPTSAEMAQARQETYACVSGAPCNPETLAQAGLFFAGLTSGCFRACCAFCGAETLDRAAAPESVNHTRACPFFAGLATPRASPVKAAEGPQLYSPTSPNTPGQASPLADVRRPSLPMAMLADSIVAQSSSPPRGGSPGTPPPPAPAVLTVSPGRLIASVRRAAVERASASAQPAGARTPMRRLARQAGDRGSVLRGSLLSPAAVRVADALGVGHSSSAPPAHHLDHLDSFSVAAPVHVPEPLSPDTAAHVAKAAASPALFPRSSRPRGSSGSGGESGGESAGQSGGEAPGEPASAAQSPSPISPLLPAASAAGSAASPAGDSAGDSAAKAPAANAPAAFAQAANAPPEKPPATGLPRPRFPEPPARRALAPLNLPDHVSPNVGKRPASHPVAAALDMSLLDYLQQHVLQPERERLRRELLRQLGLVSDAFERAIAPFGDS